MKRVQKSGKKSKNREKCVQMGILLLKSGYYSRKSDNLIFSWFLPALELKLVDAKSRTSRRRRFRQLRDSKTSLPRFWRACSSRRRSILCKRRGSRRSRRRSSASPKPAISAASLESATKRRRTSPKVDRTSKESHLNDENRKSTFRHKIARAARRWLNCTKPVG